MVLAVTLLDLDDYRVFIDFYDFLICILCRYILLIYLGYSLRFLINFRIFIIENLLICII